MSLATLFHQAKPVNWVAGLPETALTPSAFCLLLVRVSVLRLALFLVIQCRAIYARLPWLPVTNHWIFTFFVCLTGLIALIRAARKDATWTPNAGAWLDEFSGPARIPVLVPYLFTTLRIGSSSAGSGFR